MAVAFTNLTSGSDTDGNTTAVTASVTLTANRLCLMSINQFQAGGGSSAAPTCTGWDQVASFEYFTSGGVLFARQTVLRRMPSSNETGAHTINFATGPVEARWSIDQSDTNVATGGTNGSAAIVQSGTASGAAVSTISVTLSAFSDTDNGTFGSVGSYGGGMSAWTVGSGFTALANDAGGFSTDISLLTEYRTDNDTTVDASTSTSVDGIGVIGIEIAAAAAGGYTIVADSGTYNLTGTSNNLLYPRTMAADFGSYGLTGRDANLVRSGSYAFNAEAGSYTLVGSNALVDIGMNAEVGSYTLTGRDATLNFAGFTNPVLTAEFGSYGLTGRAANTWFNRRLVAEVGVYALTGRQAGLIWSGAPASTGYASQRMTFSTLTISL